MKAITILQPFAWLIVAGIKDVENRTWRTKYRGPLLIHAGKRLHSTPIEMIEAQMSIAIPRDALEFGGVIGCVELVDVVEKSPSRWFSGPYGFVLARARSVSFEPVRGAQRLFDHTCAAKIK